MLQKNIFYILFFIFYAFYVIILQNIIFFGEYMDNRNYTEIKCQLEYFYLIPVDRIIATLTKEISNMDNKNNEQIINTIFRHVFRGSSFYYDFIDANINHTFFNENHGTKLRRGLCHLIYLSLQNNCILNAFFEELALKSKPIKLSAKNVASMKSIIIDMIDSEQNIKLPKGEVDSQFFNNRKGIYEKDQEISSYTNMVINSLNISRPQTESFPIEILQYIFPATSFLFMGDTCCKFGRSVNSKNILDKYNALCEKSQEQQEKYSNPVDALIFQSEMEIIFGFSFFSSICNHIESIHQMALSENKGLKNLEGQPFTNIILQMANLPLFFGKELIYKYICHSFLDSSNIDFTYFEESAKEIATTLPPPLPQMQQVRNGLTLMSQFLQILNSISLPVLFSLWNVVIHELIQNTTLPEDVLSIYKEYLIDNFDALIYKSDHLSDEDIRKLTIECLRLNKSMDNNMLRRYICTDKKSDSSAQQSIPLYNLSSYSKEIMNQLICGYCNINSLKEFRAPLFFLASDEFATYSSLSHFITSLQYNPDCFDKREYYRRKSFLITHRNSIFEYLFSTTPPYT